MRIRSSFLAMDATQSINETESEVEEMQAVTTLCQLHCDELEVHVLLLLH